MADIVVFGTGALGRLVRTYIDATGVDSVVAHCVDEQHGGGRNEFNGLPVVTSENLLNSYPPTEVAMFVAIGYRRVNVARAEVYSRMKRLGYTLPSYVGPRATVSSDLQIGDNCLIFDGATIEPFVRVGNDTVIWSASCVAHDTVIGAHCFLAPMSSVSGNVTIGDYVFVGNNATIRDGVVIADRTVIGAGALIKRNTGPGEIYSPHGTDPAPDRDSSELDTL